MKEKNHVDNTITTLEMCAGYGGIGLGIKNIFGERLRTLAYCELEGFAQANLISKMEKGLLDVAPIWNDLKTFPYESFHGLVDILIAGYPCQPFSAAGKRAGKEDPRHLWPWIADGIRLLQPTMCFFENVEGHISLGLSTVISDLEELGYKVSWGIFSASEVGAPHQRKRVFILAHRSDERLGCWETERWAISDWSKRAEIWNQPIGQGGVSGELANSKCEGSQGGVFGREDTQRKALDGHLGCSSSSCGVWPSRPGEPQYAWEPPRVIGGKLADSNNAGWEAGRDHSITSDRGGRPHGSSSHCSNQEPARLEDSNGSRGEEPEHQQANLPTEPSGGNAEAVGNATSDGRQHDKQPKEGRWAATVAESSQCELGYSTGERPHRGAQDGLGLQPEMLGEGYEAVGNPESRRTGGCGNKDSEREGLGFIGTSPSGDMGDTEQLLLSTPREHGAMDEASGIPANGERCESSQANPIAGATREREGDGRDASECSKIESSLGRDAYEPSIGVDISELSGLSHSELAEIREWMFKTDNRTDELRLLGNGVVPATATRAFLTLLEKITK